MLRSDRRKLRERRLRQAGGGRRFDGFLDCWMIGWVDRAGQGRGVNFSFEDTVMILILSIHNGEGFSMGGLRTVTRLPRLTRMPHLAHLAHLRYLPRLPRLTRMSRKILQETAERTEVQVVASGGRVGLRLVGSFCYCGSELPLLCR